MGIAKTLGSFGLLMLLCSGLVQAQSQATSDNYSDPDPWEGVNRKIFVFNDTVDRYFLKPVAKGYRAVTPDPVETGVSNFFNNLTEVRNIVNDVLQWKWGQAGNDSGRLLVNSTLGIGGIFEVAGHMGLARNDGEDFGQTFAVWGSGRGPYVVLPFLGGSTVRDAFGIPFNSYTNPISHVEHVPTRNTLRGSDLIDTRARLLEAEDMISGDKYTFVRDSYLQRRQYLIQDGNVEDDFGRDPAGGEFGGGEFDF